VREKKNIILFGDGSFGRQLYKYLAHATYNIKVVSTKDENAQLGLGDGIYIHKINIKKNDDILSLGIDAKKDLLYCAMQKTANNLFLILTLKTLFSDANIIAISNSFENRRKLEYAGANNVINLYEATSRHVVHSLTKPAVRRALDEIVYKQNNLQMAEIEIEKGSFLDGVLVKDIDFKSLGVILIAIIDIELGHDLVFTDHRMNNKLDVGDVLVVVAKIDELKKFKDTIAPTKT